MSPRSPDPDGWLLLLAFLTAVTFGLTAVILFVMEIFS